MNKKKLWKLRQQIVLNSLYTGDYENNFGIDSKIVQYFFDSYIEELEYILEEKYTEEEIENLVNTNKYYDELFMLDNKDTLYNYYESMENVGF